MIWLARPAAARSPRGAAGHPGNDLSPFTSILFPSYAQSGRGIRIREVPLDRIAECITSRTTLVAVSAVQSADGRVADLDALHAASRATGVRVLLATTEAVGWLPVNASRFAYTACGGYKWLLSPRGAPPTSPSIAR